MNEMNTLLEKLGNAIATERSLLKKALRENKRLRTAALIACRELEAIPLEKRHGMDVCIVEHAEVIRVAKRLKAVAESKAPE